MAIQDKTLSGAEHDFFATRSGLGNSATLEEHKTEYFISKGFGSNATIHKPLGQMESEWLANVGSSTANSPYELWLNACQAQSCQISGSVDDLKFNFYTGVPDGTNP